MLKIAGRKIIIGGILLLVVVLTSIVYSHCQIPCRIYGDPARFNMISEHITTIEKSMKEISQLSKEDKPNMNRMVRWVSNKDKHADELRQIVTYYFMAQRFNPVEPDKSEDYEKYITKFTLLHKMLVYSTKAKQTTDLSNVEKLGRLLTQFRTEYLKVQK